MIHYITSKTNARIKEICQLKDNAKIKEQGLFLVEGFHLLEMAANANLLVGLISLKPLEAYHEIEQIIVTKDILKKIASTVSPQGVIGICKTFKEGPNRQCGKILYLDDVQDPGNVGTLIRTAVAFGFNLVVLSDKCASIYNEKVISSSQGAIFSIPIALGGKATLEHYKNAGFQLVATSLNKAVSLGCCKFKMDLVLILGNEGRGVSNEILELATDIVKIPIRNIDSLNVAVAGGILMNSITNK